MSRAGLIRATDCRRVPVRRDGYRLDHWGCHAVRVDRLSQRAAQAEADERRRRRLAERLALELATASHTRGSDFVAARMVQVRWSSTVEFQIAVDQAPTMVFIGDPANLGTFEGDGGVVMVVHLPDNWWVVFPGVAFTGLILVCDVDLKEHCMQLYDDSPEAREAVENFRLRVVRALENRAKRIADGWLPPDPKPLPVPDL